MGLMRTGAVVAAGAMIGHALARRTAHHGDGPAQRSRWLTVTVNAPPEKVDERLADAVAELDVETRVTPAPGGRGTEVAARLRDAPATGVVRRVAGQDPRQDVRRALRDMKSLVETGEVVRPDEPTTGRRTPGGALVRLATRRAGGEGRL
jgi:hypothetical protein